jgi:hypothetical protein
MPTTPRLRGLACVPALDAGALTSPAGSGASGFAGEQQLRGNCCSPNTGL